MSRRTDRRIARLHIHCITCGKPIRDRDPVQRVRGGWAHTPCTKTKATTP